MDENLKPIEGTEFEIPCDTVVIAAGLRPNTYLLEKLGVIIDPSTGGPVVNELLETNIPGVFAAGNALVINDLVDYVVEQGELAAEGAYIFVKNDGMPTTDWKPVIKGRNIRLAVPHYVSGERDVRIYARVREPEKRVFVRIPEINYRKFHMAVRPAEMIVLDLSRDDLSKLAQKKKLTLEVVPIGQKS
ncbi:MAG: FAD-dependent oxidoreductase [Thermoprotei archaeon]